MRTIGCSPTATALRDPGWAYAVEIPTIRKTRQAIGRVVRGPDDFGVRILADRRYTSADMGKYSVRGAFRRRNARSYSISTRRS